MAYPTLYSPMVNSPPTELTTNITATQTTIPVGKGSVFPAAPTLAVIGTDTDAETVLITKIVNDSGGATLTVTRGFQGSAKAWSAGESVARNFTAYDQDALNQWAQENKAAIDLNKAAIANMSTAISKTYAELAALKSSSQLVPGQLYLMSDYATKYRQPVSNVIKTLAVEPLVLTAESNNQFSPIVFSPAYPTDVIYYNFSDNKCEDNSTARNGFILRRIDPVRRIDMPHDWRFMQYARYLVDTSSMATWNTGDSVSKNTFYITGTSISKALKDGTPTSATDGNYWVEVVTGFTTNYFLFNTAYGLTRSNTYNEYFVFDLNGVNDHSNTSITNIIINGGADNYRGLENNVWRYAVSPERPYEIIAGGGFENNTSLGNNRSQVYGALCYGNVFGSSSTYNNWGTLCYNNILCNGSNSVFGAVCAGNILGEGSHYNNFEQYCSGNNFGKNSSSNKLRAFCENNNLGAGCTRNTLDSGVSGNTIPANVRRVTVGTSISSKNFSEVAELVSKDYPHAITLNASNKCIVTWLDATNTPQYLEVS